MVLSVLLNFMYPPPASIFITAMSVLSFVSMSNAGWTEIKGKNMRYSKFRHIGIEKQQVSGKLGMAIIYGPAFLAGASSFLLFPYGFGDGDFRFTLLRSTVTIHFLKRVLEVLFVHKYSGPMDVETAITISVSYFLTATTMIYSQYLTQPLPEPAINLMYLGIPMFLLGISGNLYHHYLLSKLRTKGDKKYKIPQGGLFRFVICPHYLFEILGFLGISCISQTLYPFCYVLGTTFYLMGRSYATRKWYQSKFEDFPKHVKKQSDLQNMVSQQCKLCAERDFECLNHFIKGFADSNAALSSVFPLISLSFLELLSIVWTFKSQNKIK